MKQLVKNRMQYYWLYSGARNFRDIQNFMRKPEMNNVAQCIAQYWIFVYKMEDTSEVRGEHKFNEDFLDKYLIKYLQGYPVNSNQSLLVRQYR